MTDEIVETVEQKLARWAYVIDAQSKEIDRLRAEVARLTEGASAHSTLVDIYRNRDLPESLRAKAATAALPVEKGKMPTAYWSLDVDRKQRWLAYERFLLTKRRCSREQVTETTTIRRVAMLLAVRRPRTDSQTIRLTDDSPLTIQPMVTVRPEIGTYRPRMAWSWLRGSWCDWAMTPPPGAKICRASELQSALAKMLRDF